MYTHAQVFECYDSNTNGIEFSEFEMIGNAINQPADFVAKMEMCTMDPEEALFKECDQDTDGKL